MENNTPKIATLNCESWAGAFTPKSEKAAQPHYPILNATGIWKKKLRMQNFNGAI